MTSIRIVYRASSRHGRHKGRLCLRLIHGRKSKVLTTEHRVYGEEFDRFGQSVKLPSAHTPRGIELREIDSKLRQTILRLKEIIDTLGGKHSYTVDEVVNNYRMSETKNSFRQFVGLLSQDLLLAEKHRTARSYESLCSRIVRFNKGKDFSLDRVDKEFVCAFQDYLQKENLSMNTISFYMRNLRAIYNKAIKNGHLSYSPINIFSKVYTGTPVTRKRALNQQEIVELKNIDFSELLNLEADKLRQVRDLFLFSFYARGMSFVDLAHLKKSNIKNDVLSYTRRKTKQPIEISLNVPMQEIIERYANNKTSDEYIFPIIKDQANQLLQYQTGLRTQNSCLKRLGTLAGISKNISTHVARHSWASIAKSEKLSIWIISESLGHTSLKTTYIYLASFDRSKLDEANEKVLRAVS